MDKILREGSGAGISQAITVAAQNCHAGILRKLLQFSPDISTESLCTIIKYMEGDITETMAILMEKDTFYDQRQANIRGSEAGFKAIWTLIP